MTSSLYQQAMRAKDQAYAPYSKFHVGACLKTTEGQTFSGCNVENTSYGLTLCAEAGAIQSMVVAGQTRIEEIAIVSSGQDHCYPCGACRQRLAEFSDAHTQIHCFNAAGEVKTLTLASLLPHNFDLKTHGLD